MDQRLSLVTLVVADVEAARRFYADGLGWEPAFVGADVAMFRVAEKVLLSLWDAAAAAAEIGEVSSAGAAPVTLAHNVATREEVDAVLALARRAGSPRVGEAVEREWGGYSGYFADRDGFRWEVAQNPGPLGDSLLP